jgi:hypothetical protein
MEADRMKGAQRAARGLLLLAAACGCAGAHAQAAAADPTGWQFAVSIYGYLPSVTGNSQFPADPSGTPIKLDPANLLDSIKGAGMASFDVRRNAWGVFVDAMYLHLGDAKQNTRDFSIGDIGVPAGTTANLEWDLRGQIWTIAGAWRFASGPALTVDALAGVRYSDVKQSLAWSFAGNIGPIAPEGRSGRSEGSVHVLDGIVGVKGRMVVSDNGRWSVPFYLDVGTGDSKLTWQAVGGISYGFGWGEVTGAWRYLQYRRDTPRIFEDFTFNGPMVGATFRW